MFTAEIISIGDEITLGKIFDTNNQWLSQRLTELGVRVLYHSAVGDEMGPIVQVLQIAAHRADFVLCTGGLGPTADDLTRQAIAELLDVPLIQDTEMLDNIREMFRRRGRTMPESNGIQAFLPQGAEFIPNQYGTAPGVFASLVHDQKTTRIFAMPGVPAEMQEMWHKTVAPNIRKFIGVTNFIKTRTIHTFGQGESLVEQMLPDLICRDHYPRVGITASEATITLRIVAEEETENACDKVIAPVAALIYENLGDLVYGEGDDTLADVVCRKLCRDRKTLATLEWNTGGLLAESFSRARDSRSCFMAGLVIQSPGTYSSESVEKHEWVEGHYANQGATNGSGKTPDQFPNSLKMLFHLFGFQSEDELFAGLLDGDFSPESQQQLLAMTASELRDRFMTDYALVIGPYPEHELDRKEPESVWVALATGEEVRLVSHPYAGHPSLINIMTVNRAINFLRLHDSSST